jgi:hypothetical protein
MGMVDGFSDEQHLPTILTKDDFVSNLLLSEIKSVKRDIYDIKMSLSEHCKNFNEFKITMSPFAKLDFVTLSKLLAINPYEMGDTIHFTKTQISVNKIFLPIIITMMLGLTLLGLREYIRGNDIKLIKPTSELLMPKREGNLS